MRAARQRTSTIRAVWRQPTSLVARLNRREILESIKAYESLAVKDFAPGEPVDLTALVELDSDGTRAMYFLGPSNGGLEMELGRTEVTVITQQSPLGQESMEKAGQRWTTRLGGSMVKHQIISVH